MTLRSSLHFGVIAVEKRTFELSSTKIVYFTLTLLLQIFKTIEKSEFCVLIKHCFLMWKHTVKAKVWFDEWYSDLLRRKQRLRDGMLTLNAVEQINDAKRSSHSNMAVVPENTNTNYANLFWTMVNWICMK